MKTTISPKTATAVRGMTTMFMSLLMLGVLMTPEVGYTQANPDVPPRAAQKAFVDTFNGPNGGNVLWRPNNCTMTFGHGVMSLTEPSFRLPSGRLGWVDIGKDAGMNEGPIVAEDSSIQVVLRMGSGLSRPGEWWAWSMFAVATRMQGWAKCETILASGGDVWFSIGGEVARMSTPLDPTTSDIVLEVDTIGNTLTARVWALDNPDDVYSLFYDGSYWPADPVYGPPPQVPVRSGGVAFGFYGINWGLHYGLTEPDPADAAVDIYGFQMKIIPPTSNRR